MLKAGPVSVVLSLSVLGVSPTLALAGRRRNSALNCDDLEFDFQFVPDLYGAARRRDRL